MLLRPCIHSTVPGFMWNHHGQHQAAKISNNRTFWNNGSLFAVHADQFVLIEPHQIVLMSINPDKFIPFEGTHRYRVVTVSRLAGTISSYTLTNRPPLCPRLAYGLPEPPASHIDIIQVEHFLFSFR